MFELRQYSDLSRHIEEPQNGIYCLNFFKNVSFLLSVLYFSHPGAPQGCVLSPLLFSMYSNDSTSKDASVKLLKFADDTTVIGLIQDGNKSAYRQEVKELAVWCSLNNLELNTLKTVKMIVTKSQATITLSRSVSLLVKNQTMISVRIHFSET